MRIHSTESSSLAGFGYDPKRRTLRVRFHSGEIYDYFGVPPREAEGLQAAESKGRFFLSHIRGRFDYHRVRHS